MNIKKNYIKKISDRYSMKLRPIRKTDYTLTKNKEIMLKDTYIHCCYCCESELIQEIIKRPFTECGFCYCCVGDDPNFDNPDLCIFVNYDLTKKFIFWDKNSPFKFHKYN